MFYYNCIIFLDAKRLIGRRFEDSTVQADMKHLPFDVIFSGSGKPKIKISHEGENKLFSPEEVIKQFYLINFKS